MISAEQSAEIRRLFYAEHWKVGTIAEAMGLHRDAVKRAIGAESFLTRSAARARPTKLDPYLPFVRRTLEYDGLVTHTFGSIWGWGTFTLEFFRSIDVLRSPPITQLASLAIAILCTLVLFVTAIANFRAPGAGSSRPELGRQP